MGEPLDTGDEMGSGRGEEAAIGDAVADLTARAMPHPWSASQIRESLSSPRACLMCEEGAAGDLIGFVLGRRVDRDVVEVDLVAVDPDHRRRGIGRRVLAEMVAAEQTDGVREFRLELAADNVAALGLYTSVGFVVVGQRARYYPDGEDALLLTLTAEGAAGRDGHDERRGP